MDDDLTDYTQTLYPRKNHIKRELWKCPEHPRFQTDWPAGKARHLATKHKAPEPEPTPETSSAIILPKAADPPKLGEIEKCGYFNAQFPQEELRFAWACLNRKKQIVLHFPIRIEWTLCPRCSKETAYVQAKLKPGPAWVSERTAKLQSIMSNGVAKEKSSKHEESDEDTGPLPEELADSEKIVLKVLEESKGPVKSGDLGELTGLPPKTIYFAMNRLVRRDLVQRRFSIVDGRTRLISLKPKKAEVPTSPA